ncbi:MAG: hypothetical protein J0I43_14340 [Microbacterium sp.]|uniref:hypothetical protein n=1 Tax=Microbacterium sp. TaxID=51671 RepID=UPI001AD4BA78|nr:hypothetical protein [Microbacterium sp.]MBN9178528.1 hypothetical protein [Microbacterium sp.]
MSDSVQLSAQVVDSVSLDRALRDVEVANRRVIDLAKDLLDREEQIAKLNTEIVALKRLMDPRRRMEHIFRRNHALYAAVRRTKRMLGR